MTGGMDSTRGPSLAERVGIGAPPSTAPDEADTAEDRAALGRAVTKRHCWVIDPPGAPGRWPGLLIEWRHDPAPPEGGSGPWQGRVAYVVVKQLGASVLVEEWLSAALLRPD